MSAKSIVGRPGGPSLPTGRTAMDRLRAMDAPEAKVTLPKIGGFREMLATHARVKAGSDYVPYHFAGREMLQFVAELIDLVLGSETGKPLEDATLAICGGAQFGKTVLVLNLLAYMLGSRFMSVAYYLPDKELIDAVVDGKFRPDVVEQIGWFAPLIQLGKTINKSGKAVNRKGAILCTDGKRTALGYVLALNKPATTVSADVVIVDERDDVKEEYAKYVGGRLTASALRLEISIGTMRIHGAGQNKQLEDGTQHVGTLTCPQCGKKHVPEEMFPEIIRLAMDGPPAPSDPRLTYEGDFKVPGNPVTVATHTPGNPYYFGCLDCGAVLDRKTIRPEAKFPERAKQRKFSVRISQLGIGAIDLNQVVKRWQDALRDPESMVVFRCDVLAMPANTSQQITPKITDRARDPELALTLGPAPAGALRYGGLDMGDRCWFTCRQSVSATRKEMTWVEQIALGSVIRRVPDLFATLSLTAIFIDSRPDAAVSRTLCMILNGLVNFPFPRIKEAEKAYISFGPHLTWDGPNGRWNGLRAAVVEFTKAEGGLRQRLRVTDDGLMFPVVQVERDQTIQRVVNEFLTAEEGVVELIDGKLRTEPMMRTPDRKAGSPVILQAFENHMIVGSQKVKDNQGVEHFIDKVENHLLLSNAYSGLAERVVVGCKATGFAYDSVSLDREGPVAGSEFGGIERQGGWL